MGFAGRRLGGRSGRISLVYLCLRSLWRGYFLGNLRGLQLGVCHLGSFDQLQNCLIRIWPQLPLEHDLEIFEEGELNTLHFCYALLVLCLYLRRALVKTLEQLQVILSRERLNLDSHLLQRLEPQDEFIFLRLR